MMRMRQRLCPPPECLKGNILGLKYYPVTEHGFRHGTSPLVGHQHNSEMNHRKSLFRNAKSIRSILINNTISTFKTSNIRFTKT